MLRLLHLNRLVLAICSDESGRAFHLAKLRDESICLILSRQQPAIKSALHRVDLGTQPVLQTPGTPPLGKFWIYSPKLLGKTLLHARQLDERVSLVFAPRDLNVSIVDENGRNDGYQQGNDENVHTVYRG